MDLKQFRAIAPLLDKEIEEVCKKFGLKTGKRSATVDPINGTISYRLTLIDENLKDASGNKTTPEALFYSNNAEYLGMKAEWLNKPVTFGGRVLTIVGLKNSRSQKPVLFKIEGRNGTFIASTGDARTWFGLKRDLSAEDFRLVEVAPPVKGAA